MLLVKEGKFNSMTRRLTAYESSKLYKEKVKQYHDKKILKREFYPGQSVLLFNSRISCFLVN